MSLALGVRRVGKSSLLRVFAKMCSYPYIFIDARKLPDYGYSRAGFYRIPSEEFSKQKKFLRKVPDYLKNVRGVKLFETYVEFEWRNKELSISSIPEKLNDYTEDSGSLFLVIVDEVQEMRYLRGYGEARF